MDTPQSNFISSFCSTSSSPYPSASCAYPHQEDTSMLSVSEWKQLYPSDLYKQRASFALHFLLALGQKLETITGYIASLKAKNPERLVQADAENHSLTPLHIAAMKANVEGAKVLLAAFATKEEKLDALRREDAYGWTPLHHAACTSNSLFQLFIEEGGNPQSKSSNGSTPKDLRFFSGREVSVKSETTLFALTGTPKSLIPVAALNREQKDALFGPSFLHTDHPIYPTTHLKALWQTSPNPNTEIIRGFIAEKHSEFMAKRPSLAVQECKELSGIVPNNLELVANEDISAMSVVKEYTGLVNDALHPKSFLETFNEEFILSGEYSFEGVDARFAGNEARFANMGFPNCVISTVVIDGVEKHLLISLRPIKKGEPIHFSYGPSMSPLVLGRQVLLGKEEMEQFYREHRDIANETLLKETQLIVKARGGALRGADILNLLSLQTKLCFPLDCPTALLYLHFRGIIPFTVFADSFYTNSSFQPWANKSPYEAKMFICITNVLRKTDALSQKNTEYDALIKQFVLDKLEKEPLISILKGLDLIGTGDLLKSRDDLIQRIAEVETFLSTYNWKTDPDHPFSFERMVQVSLAYYKLLPRDMAVRILKMGIQSLPTDSDSYAMTQEVLKRL